jgi:hypothetical protein
MRRGATSCRAVPSSCPVVAAVRTRRRCRDRPEWPSAPKRRDPGEVGPPSGWSPVAGSVRTRPGRSLPCPRPQSHRADVRPAGRADIQCPDVRCPGVQCIRCPDGQASGVRALPRCPRRAGSWSGSVWRAAAPRLGAAGRRAAVVRGRRGRLLASGLTGRDGTTWPWLARTRVDRSPGPPLGWLPGCGAAWPPGRGPAGWGSMGGE